MAEYVIFGGTSEGRQIAELMQKHGKSATVCVATEYGQALLHEDTFLEVHTGRMPLKKMCTFLKKQSPRLVIDATHPYADMVSKNIRSACEAVSCRYLRVRRRETELLDCMVFDDMSALISYLNRSNDIVFSTLGAKEAAALREISEASKRLWLRILPSQESLALCTAASFPLSHIICMQGPFSEELNAAMLLHTGARVLITKDSGKAGGFSEKLTAAKKLGVTVAVLRRPVDTDGISMMELEKRLKEDSL